jgi:hypothetical protein
MGVATEKDVRVKSPEHSTVLAQLEVVRGIAENVVPRGGGNEELNALLHAIDTLGVLLK